MWCVFLSRSSKTNAHSGQVKVLTLGCGNAAGAQTMFVIFPWKELLLSLLIDFMSLD